jgi:PAS domain S-box-containing protein
MSMIGSRLRPLAIGWTVLLVLFLITLAFQLAVMQRDVDQRGFSGVQPTADILMKVLGGLLLLVPLYGALSRVLHTRHARQTSRDSAGAPGTVERDRTVVIDAFHDVVQRLREKEQELERLRSEAEARAQEIESYNENILRSVASGVITFNQDAVVTTFNEAAARILRMEPDKVIGRTCAEVFGSASKVTALLERSHGRGIAITREQFELEQPRGRRIWVGVSTSLLKDRADRFIGTTFVFTDLTEVKALQAQVELRERMTVVGEMSAGIAHEFRNFMGTILGAAKLIARQAPPNDCVQDSVGTILHVISDMDHLITQFLNFSKTTELNLKPVELEPWIKRVVDQILSQTSERRPRITIACSPHLPPIPMDEVLMRQALGNLVQNAVEAMPKGGSLNVNAELLSVHAKKREVELRVSDTGYGIPPDRLEKIFLPFYTTKPKGTGLGLALVHKIILLHNGRIQVESREGEGTTFRVRLPIEDEV